MGIYQVTTAVCVLWSVCDVSAWKGSIELPGLFSASFCRDPQLAAITSPWCSCTNGTQLDDETLCRSYEELGDCLKNNLTDNPYMHSVYSQDRMVANLRYLCEIRKDIEDSFSCVQANVTAQCDLRFQQQLSTSRTSLSHYQETACNITKTMGICQWKHQTRCPAKTRHYLAKLSEVYLSDHCTKYGSSVDGHCSELVKRVHPSQGNDTRQCIDDEGLDSSTISSTHMRAAVDTMAACYRRDRLHSKHHEDRFHNLEFDVERFIRFSHFVCEVREERDDSCFRKQRSTFANCFLEFKSGRGKLWRKLRTGGNVTIKEACSVHDKLSACQTSVFATCPLERRYFLANVCAHVPTSCSCPLDITSYQHGRLAMSSSGATAASHLTRNTALFIYVVYSTGMWKDETYCP